MGRNINLIAILHGFTILWVVIGHAPLDDVSMPSPLYVTVLYKISHLFCMPMFFLISGYLFRHTRKEWPYWKMVLDKLKRLGIPYVFFSSIAYILKAAFPGEMMRPINIGFADYLRCFLYPGQGALAELWFPATLLLYFLFSPLWGFILSGKFRPYLALIPLIALHLCDFKIEFMCIGNFLHYALFYFLGMFLFETGTLKGVKMANIWRYSLFASVFEVVGCFWDIYFFQTVGAVILVYVFCYFLDKQCPSIFCSFRNYSYQIFLMGIFPQILVKIMYHHNICPSYLVSFLICIIVGLYLPVLVSLAVSRGPNFFKMLIGLK